MCGWWERRGILSPFGGDGSQAAQVLLVLLGFLIMIFALVPGAQFWFGLLTKLNTLRTTGPPPAPAASNPVTLTVVPPPVAPTQAVAAAAAPATAAPEPKAPPEARVAGYFGRTHQGPFGQIGFDLARCRPRQ